MTGMEVVALLRVGFEAGKYIWENIVKAEHSTGINSGKHKSSKKKTFVLQNVNKKIDEMDIAKEILERHDIVIDPDTVDEIKAKVKNQVSRKIDVAVDTMNKTGMFIKGD